MLILGSIGQKDFSCVLMYTYVSDHMQTGHQFLMKVKGSAEEERSVMLGQHLHGALVMVRDVCRNSIGRKLTDAFVDNIAAEFDIRMESMVAMHVANLTDDERFLMQQDAEFEAWQERLSDPFQECFDAPGTK